MNAQPVLRNSRTRPVAALASSLALIASSMLGAAPALAEPGTKASQDASIPFANHGGIRNWHADRDRGLWVQDVHGNWYYAALMGPCTGLNYAETIGFDTRPNGTFDRWSAVVVPQWGRCVVQTFTPSGGPPVKRRHDAKPAPADSTEEAS